MLNIDYFKLKHLAKVSWLTGSASNGNANTRVYDSTCTKNMGKWFQNQGNDPNMQTELLTAKLLNRMFLCIVDVHVFKVKKTYNGSVT